MRLYSQNCSVASGVIDAKKQTKQTKNPLTGPKKLFLMFFFFYLLFELNSLTTIFFFCFHQGHLDPSSKASGKLPAWVWTFTVLHKFCFFGTKGKRPLHYWLSSEWYLSAVGRRMSDLQALQNAFTIPFMFQLLKFSIPKTFWVLTFWLMVPLALTCS